MLLLIDNYDSFTYNLYQCVASFYDHIRVLRNDKVTINEINQMQPTGIILSPGPGRPEKAGVCIDIINALTKKYISSIPLLGVCLGHQAIVAAMGGNVVQAEEIVHGKYDYVFHSQSDLYQSLPSPFKAGRYHSLIVERETLPSDLIIDAENNKKIIMGIRHAELPIYGMQFHPESILTPEGQQILHTFTAMCRGTEC